MPQPEFHPAAWTSSRKLDFIPQAGLHPAGWTSSRKLDFIPQAGLHLVAWTSSRRLDFISQPGLHPAGWTSSRRLDFIAQAGLYPAGWTSSRRLDFIPQAGRSSRSLEGSVNPLCDRYTLDPLPLNTPANKGDPEHLTLRAAGFAGGRPCFLIGLFRIWTLTLPSNPNPPSPKCLSLIHI